MAWTTPKTDWETGELVAASDMNEIGENLAVLKTSGNGGLHNDGGYYPMRGT